eukprot:NODE_190_length_15503_cov_0.365814.p16 type:complete len:100 gc:universal NODE_190_length_15503_cov_0.365814:14962-14663(-)
MFYLRGNKFYGSKLLYTNEQDLVKILIVDDIYVVLDCTNTVLLLRRNQLQTTFFMNEPVVEWISSHGFIMILFYDSVKVYNLQGHLFSQIVIPNLIFTT